MTTEELLSRMEREHVQQGHLCVGCWDAGTDDYWLPCDVARVVAHARSLEAALPVLTGESPHARKQREVWEARAAGWTLAEVAKAHGVTRERARFMALAHEKRRAASGEAQ